MFKVFDGHNDVLLRLWEKPAHERVKRFIHGDNEGHLDLPRMKKAGFAGGFFAIFPPPEASSANYSDPNPPDAPPLSRAAALAATLGMADLLVKLAAESAGRLRLCRTVAEIRAAEADEAVAAIMHIEGLEAVGEDLDGLHLLHAAGLRSLGPVWSRSNVFGHGVPFRFPSSPDTGPGLTAAGKRLVAACNDLGILVDLSHLNEKGFWDVAELSDAPLVATHSNAHALCPSARNLTDAQLKAISQSRGVVGLNYAVGFLRADGGWGRDVSLDVLVAHAARMIEVAGENGVALGSDFDGADIPDAIGDVLGLPRLIRAMEQAGFGAALIRKITHDNWLSVLERTWKPEPLAS
jgi:membrane dipeptidase